MYDLHGKDFIMYDAIIGKYSFELLSSLFLNSGVKPNYVQYVSQPTVFLGLVKASVGVALLRQALVEKTYLRTFASRKFSYQNGSGLMSI